MEDNKKIKNDDTVEDKNSKESKKHSRRETLAILIIGVLCAGAFIAWDVMKNKTVASDPASVKEMITTASEKLHNTNSIRVAIKQDCYVEVTKGTIMTPYACGEDIVADITTDPYLLHIDGYTVHQANSSRNRNIYEKYLEISAGTTTAYTNRDDLIWTKDTYGSKNTIFDSFDFYDMVLDNIDSFENTGTYNVGSSKCYAIQGELYYKDMQPYIDDLTVFEDGKSFWGSIDRNGFYAWVSIYVDMETGQVRELYLDFKDIAQAFADKDGAIDGYSALVSTFYMKVDYTSYNGFDTITIDQSIKDQAIDAEEFLKKLANGELSYEDALYYEALFGYTLDDFEYYAKKLGLTQEEYDYLKSLFNFDAYGRAQFPSFTEAEFQTIKQLFDSGKDFNYFHETYGWTEAQYNYYKAFFTKFQDYGAYAIFSTMNEQEFVYYYNLIQLSGNSEAAFQNLMNFIKNAYTYSPSLLSQADFEYIQSLFNTDNGYEYYKNLMGWTQGEYDFYKSLFTFIQSNQNIITNSTTYTDTYQYYVALIGAVNNYSTYTSTFKFSITEYNYYQSLFSYVSSYSDYKSYISDYESYINYVSGQSNSGNGYNGSNSNGNYSGNGGNSYDGNGSANGDYSGNGINDYNGNYALTQVFNGNSQYNTFASASSATYNYYRRLYEQIGGHNSEYKTFQAFIQYITQQGVNTVLNNQIVSIYVPDYDNKLGEDREGSGGVSSGSLSDNWYSFSVKYGSYVISVPCEYSDLANAIGYELKSDEAAEILSPNQTTTATLYKSGQSKGISVTFENTTSSNKSLKDCKVCSITIVSNLGDASSFTFPSGIKIGSSYSDVVSKYGEASSSSNTSSTTTYIYNSSVKNENMKISVKDGKVIKVTYTYY